ncbi:MAG: phytanoyl-CoA dioxygenase family protein [Flavobacteriaceae bacterium]|nr:phytanoyl-CoA dioxygenase family protein [Flavobacteriaceae bacterium]
MNSYSEYIDVKSKDWQSKAINSLSQNGVVILRGIVSELVIDQINNKANKVLSNPSALGRIGFYQKDSYKKTYDGFLLGKEVVESVSDENALDVIEKYLKDKVILNEIFLKNDLGYNIQYFPYHSHTGSDVEGDVNKPFGCAALIYLHDTNEGAFCYALKSHHLKIERKKNNFLSKREDRKEIEKKMNKIIGKKGDYVIFDERGFHGPEQPVKTSRKVLLFGYQLKKYTNNRSRTGIPIVISDMENLTDRQLDAIGVGGGTRGLYEDYHLRASSDITKKYTVVNTFIKTIIYLDLKLTNIKNFLKKNLKK